VDAPPPARADLAGGAGRAGMNRARGTRRITAIGRQLLASMARPYIRPRVRKSAGGAVWERLRGTAVLGLLIVFLLVLRSLLT